jgi:hypothetical protein
MKPFWVSDESTLTSLEGTEALSRLNCGEVAKVQRRSGPTIDTVRERARTKVRKGKEQHGMRGKELHTDQVLRSATSSGQRVGEQKLESLVRATP